MNGVWILDGDFAEKLKTVLSDPEAMAKITSIASGLGAAKSEKSAETVAPEQQAEPILPTSDNLPTLAQGFALNSDPRISLLSSLKPLLREEKRDRIDALTRALSLAAVMKNFRK